VSCERIPVAHLFLKRHMRHKSQDGVPKLDARVVMEIRFSSDL